MSGPERYLCRLVHTDADCPVGTHNSALHELYLMVRWQVLEEALEWFEQHNRTTSAANMAEYMRRLAQ